MGKIMNYNDFLDYVKDNGITKAKTTEEFENIPKGTILFFGSEDNSSLSTYEEDTEDKNLEFNYNFDFRGNSSWKCNYTGNFELVEDENQSSDRKFKVGDKVVKTRAYSKSNYCRHGGDDSEVPIGTKGKITSIEDEENTYVLFENGISWNLHQKEIELVKEVEEEKTPSKNVKMTTKKIYSVLIVDKKTGVATKDEKVIAANEQEAILKAFKVDAENTFIKVEELGSYEEEKPVQAILVKQEVLKEVPKANPKK